MSGDAGQKATVTATFSRRMTLRLEDTSEVTARIRGKRLRPVVGDRVTAAPIPNEPEWLIESIEDRENELARPDSRGRTEVLAANVTLVVVMAAAEPKPDWYVVDRYLAAAENMRATAVVALNKTDVTGAQQLFGDVAGVYEQCGYPVILCSAETGENVDELGELLRGEIAIIVGQSGVGKSSVINRLVSDADQRTAEISGATGEGRHTTVNSVMLNLSGGGVVIDSPGVRDFAPALETPSEVMHGFREIAGIADQCRFANCQHRQEPDCAVKAAVESGDIDARRFESYRRLLSLTRNLADRRY
jgi:ribosome biogenesis GTPase